MLYEVITGLRQGMFGMETGRSQLGVPERIALACRNLGAGDDGRTAHLPATGDDANEEEEGYCAGMGRFGVGGEIIDQPSYNFV